jgi:hypothetical protein
MSKTRRKDTVSSSGLMDGCTEAYGRTGSSTARERSSIRMEIRLRLNGTKENESSKVIRTNRGASSERQFFYNILYQYPALHLITRSISEF